MTISLSSIILSGSLFSIVCAVAVDKDTNNKSVTKKYFKLNFNSICYVLIHSFFAKKNGCLPFNKQQMQIFVNQVQI